MKKGKIKVMVLTILSLIGVFAATASAGACWFFSFYQPECPKSLLK
jgi:cyclic lactone autoinducer peptide